MRLALQRAIVGACANLCLLLGQPDITSPAAHAAVAPPTAEAQANLKKAFDSAQAGLYTAADAQLSSSIAVWEQGQQPPDETAALYKTRGMVRQSSGRLAEALSDLSKAIELSSAPGSKPDPAEVQRTYQQRARVHRALGNTREQVADLSAAIDRLDDLDLVRARPRAPLTSAARAALAPPFPTPEMHVLAAAARVRRRRSRRRIRTCTKSAPRGACAWASGPVPPRTP